MFQFTVFIKDVKYPKCASNGQFTMPWGHRRGFFSQEKAVKRHTTDAGWSHDNDYNVCYAWMYIWLTFILHGYTSFFNGDKVITCSKEVPTQRLWILKASIVNNPVPVTGWHSNTVGGSIAP